MRDTFVMSNGVPSKVNDKTWKQIFNYVDKLYGTTVGANYGNDATTDAKNRKYFIWGMAMHYISVVPRRNDSAQYALEGVVSCALSNVYGDYNEINDGIDAPEYADDKDNYRKIKLYTYLVQCGSDYKLSRVAAASIND